MSTSGGSRVRCLAEGVAANEAILDADQPEAESGDGRPEPPGVPGCIESAQERQQREHGESPQSGADRHRAYAVKVHRFDLRDAVRGATDLDLGGGRALHVPKSLKGVAVFSFKRLCGEARGAADYLAIARAYHTVIVVGIPVMGPDMRNEAARFVTLIDTLYEHNVILFATAAAEPEGLYPEGDGSFEFERTVSRLKEMQSADYLAEGHGVHA